jgi:hypothetical protein
MYKIIVANKSVSKWGSQFSVCRGMYLANINKQFLIKKGIEILFLIGTKRKVKIYKTIIVLFVWVWNLVSYMMEEHRSKVSENKMLNRMFGLECEEMTGWWRDLHYGALNPLNTELNPICHLLALLGAHPILHFCRIRVICTLRHIVGLLKVFNSSRR